MIGVPNMFALRGSIAHNAMEWMNINKRFDLVAMLEYSVQKEREKHLKSKTLPYITQATWDSATNMARMILYQMNPMLKELAIRGHIAEEELMFERKPPKGHGKPYLLLAYLDLVVLNEGTAHIFDWKTDKEIAVDDHFLQGSVYRAMWESVYKMPANWQLAYLQKRRICRGTLLGVEETFRVTDEMVERIRKETWTPNLEACEKPFPCDVLKGCPARNGRR